MNTIPGRRIIMGAFLIFLLLPIYWLVNMSFKTNNEIVTTMHLWPYQPTIENYKRIFTDESWYSGYLNSLKYVVINTVISISVALPAAYAFSRYRFLGDKHLFFWLLSNRMAPAAVFALPFFNLYSAINLFDTPWAVALAHCIFNVPLAVWILEGFVSSVPREIDETAFLDGYSFPRFFVKILIPLIASGIGVAAFFCFMFSWVELLLAKTLTAMRLKRGAIDFDLPESKIELAPDGQPLRMVRREPGDHPEPRLAFEFRHESWFTDKTYRLLKQHGAALCIADSPGYPRRDVLTADFAYLRFHGRTELFASSYSATELKEESRLIARYLDGGVDVFAYFNNDAEGHALDNAGTLRRLLARSRTGPRRPA